MQHKDALEILKDIEESQHEGLCRDLLESASRYARQRVDWQLKTPTERAAGDRARSMSHDSFIDSCNILSRNMAQTGEPNDWRRRLGNDRKYIGDFACWIHLILGLRAR